MSIADFFVSEPREIYIALEGYKRRQEDTFMLNQIAAYNAYGLNTHKDFKPHNPFAVEQDVEEVEPEEKIETLSYLVDKFTTKEGENS